MSFTNASSVAVSHRIAAAWKSFFMHHDLLCNRNVSAFKRSRLLNSLVFPTVLWGLPCYNLTQADLSKITNTQISMLAAILNLPRPRKRPGSL
eukprot:9130980-Heterocapsa_arctica.AAC.1